MAGPELGGVPVSPPGAASQRTDLGATQAPMTIPASFYGEGQELEALQSGAPMYASPPPPKPDGLFAPSARPNEPVTSGVDFGPGLGSDALRGYEDLSVPAPNVAEALRRLSAAPSVSPRVAGLLRVVERLGW
jgi:hypothetical protein